MKTVEEIWERLVQLRPSRSGLLIFAIALLVRVAFILHFGTYIDLSRTELERTALSLATTGVFGNPYAIPTGPTGHVAPGYTLILAALFHIFGAGHTGEIVKQVLAAGIASSIYALLPATAVALHLDKRAGLIAGFVGALYPARPIVEVKGDWETPYTALALILVSILTVRLWKHRDLSGRHALLQGAAWGICLLFVPALLALFIVLVATGFLFCKVAGVPRYLRFSAIEILVAAICLSPWVIRNYRALGAPVVTRTNFGLELRISNNDDATPDQRLNYLKGVFAKYHPLLSKIEAMKVRSMGELAYNKQAGQEAEQWIRTHPERFLQLSLGRIRCYWLYFDPTSLVKTLFLGITILFGLAGWLLFIRRHRIPGAVTGLILLIYPLPNYLVHVGLRQEYPIHWLMMLLAASFVLRWIERQQAYRIS